MEVARVATLFWATLWLAFGFPLPPMSDMFNDEGLKNETGMLAIPLSEGVGGEGGNGTARSTFIPKDRARVHSKELGATTLVSEKPMSHREHSLITRPA